MSTSSNKQQKKGKDGMGKAGKRKEMVKDWCGASCVWKSKCEQVVYGQVVLYVCMHVLNSSICATKSVPGRTTENTGCHEDC